MRPVLVLGLVMVAAVLSASSCGTEEHSVDFADINFDAPSGEQIEMWKSEPFRADPRQVAHYELQMKLDVAWKGERFPGDKYTFIESDSAHPEWGAYVVRGYVDRSGRLTRYRVKVAQRDGVWFARQVSHYMMVTLVHPALEDEGPPNTEK